VGKGLPPALGSTAKAAFEDAAGGTKGAASGLRPGEALEDAEAEEAGAVSIEGSGGMGLTREDFSDAVESSEEGLAA
jgi:hypothetical protein